MKTPQELRRDNIREIFNLRMQNKTLELSPVAVEILEQLPFDSTRVNLSFQEQIHQDKQTINLVNVASDGFVDGIFKGLHDHYKDQYSSLQNIKLKDLEIRPLLGSARVNLCSDAKTRVTISSEILGHGFVDFSSVSRSIVHSTFIASLKIFQFYINCERTFDILSKVLKNAKERNRGDIVQSCIRDMSSLTQMNNYEPKENKN